MTAGGEAVSLQDQTANEEEEEAIQQKLRIALRKHKTDKIEKLRKRLGELHTIAQKQRDREEAGQRRRQQQQQQNNRTDEQQAGFGSRQAAFSAALALTPASSPSHSLQRTEPLVSQGRPSSASAESAAGPPPRSDDRRAAQLLLAAAEEGVVFTLEPNAVQSIRTDLHVNADGAVDVSAAAPDVVETYEGVVDVYESKNKDAVRAVHFTVHVCSDQDTARAARRAHRMQQRVRQQEQSNAVRAVRPE